MSVRTVVLNPSGETGYAIFLEHPKDGSAVINVMTKRYIQRVLPIGNLMLSQQLKIEPAYDPAAPTTIEKIVQYTHDCFIKMGYKDAQPHFVEQVDILYDFDEKKFAQSNDVQSSIIEIKKHYNLQAAGAFLTPSYPEVVAGFLPPPPMFPFVPMPRSPV